MANCRRTCRALSLILVFLCCSGEAGNILCFNGMGEGSHFYSVIHMGMELGRRGHNVTFIISDAFIDLTKNPEYSALVNFAVLRQGLTASEMRSRQRCILDIAYRGGNALFDIPCVSNFSTKMVSDCERIFDPSFIRPLKHSALDVIIYDPSWACSTYIAEFLNPKYKVGYMPTAINPTFLVVSGTELNPGLIPITSSGYPQKMNFVQRLKNTAIFLYLSLLVKVIAEYPYSHIRSENKIERAYFEIGKNTDLFLTSSDPIIDVPFPATPNIIDVAGLTTRPSKKLPEELEEFMQSSGEHGVIIFSLGSYVTHMPKDKVRIFAEAFARLEQKVVWQWKNHYEPPKFSDNVLTMRWLPQNDLLGHNKTRMLFYQGGNNGLYEAIYHGVPILVCPLMGDQIDIAERVIEKGIGSKVNIASITTNEIYSEITKILSDPSYKMRAKMLSDMFRDRPDTPVQRAAYWIEYLLKFGSGHLRSPSQDLNFIQLNLIDVYGFLALFTCTVLCIGYIMLRTLFRCIQRRCCEGKSKRD